MIKTIGIDNDITVADQIKFILSTTDSTGCLYTPYKINKIVIYFVSRDFVDTTMSEYTKEIYSESLKNEYDKLKLEVCNSPTEENINKLNSKKIELENSRVDSSFFYKDAIPVQTIGGYVNESGELFPAWINPDLVPPESVNQVNQDNLLYKYEENGTVVEGKFVLELNPLGYREGDYFICWDWTPNIAGNSLSAHMMFYLGSNTKLNSLPTHQTKENKYEILMEKYLPSMFKNFISEGDLSPYVLQELNASVDKGFTFIEDLANQIIDLLDANMIQEQLLPLLSNFFNLELKSNDPTLWRKQTKKAIQNYKQKGTIKGLRSALFDGGVNLLKINKLWQITSNYTYQDYFEVVDDSNEFILSNFVILPIDPNNFELRYRSKDSKDWQVLDESYIQIQEETENYVLTWEGESATVPISLSIGDSIRVIYQRFLIPNQEEQNLEDYFRLLDLMDQRDERDQLYPPKNWNVRVISEEDPLFDLMIPTRHPIAEKIIWGKVRTEFPYSENIYNMEEYNGSTRDSYDPCNIDKNFQDQCTNCQSSMISVDAEINEISNDRILECQKILKEFLPFHTLVHSTNYIGNQIEFVKSPLEEIQILLKYSKEESLISGNAQFIFNRSIQDADLNLVKRNLLAQIEDKTGEVTGTIKNTSIRLFSPSFSEKADLENIEFRNKINSFHQKNINIYDIGNSSVLENSNLLEILSPSSNSGWYTVSNVNSNYLEFLGNIIEPLDKSQFEFRVSNKIYEQSSVSISQNDSYTFYDNNFNFHEILIVSKSDSNQPYKLEIENNINYTYDILEILPDNKFIVDGPVDSDEFGLDRTNINWRILDYNNNEICTGETGNLLIKEIGLVDLGSISEDIREKCKINDYIFISSGGTLLYLNQFKIINFNDSNKFSIINYDGGDLGGVEIKVYRRIIENCVGQLDYYGLELITTENYESTLSIQNGTNLPEYPVRNSLFKENFLILIGSNYYSILDIDAQKITLDGIPNDLTTLGSSVTFSIYQFINQQVSIPETEYPKNPGYDFEEITRSDNEIIVSQTENISSFVANRFLNNPNAQEDFFSQKESINYKIEYKEE